jgi:N-acetyl-gamma-glutamyl-phosphate reductase
MQTNVLVFGGSGYSGLELLRLIAQHPEIKLSGASSNRWENAAIRDYAPQWPGQQVFVSHDRLFEMASENDVAFLATHATVSHDLAPKLLKRGLKVIDISGAFRLAQIEDVQRWYGFDHKHQDLLSQAVYGLPELFAESYRGQAPNLIANPGCYPTATILSLAPLLHADLLRLDVPIHVDGKSGVTGAGRKLADNLLYNEVADTFRPYRLIKHQHTPEIERFLTEVAKQAVQVSFTPHLIPVRRGLMTSSYAQAKDTVRQADIDEAYRDYYSDQPFVRVQYENTPHPGGVVHSNYCDVMCKIDPRTQTVLAFGAIDNLVKGAAGQALQNYNLCFGLDQGLGLLPQENS